LRPEPLEAGLLEPDDGPLAAWLERDLDLGRGSFRPADLRPGEREALARLPGGDSSSLKAGAALEVVDLDEAPTRARFDPHREAALGVVPVGRVPPPPEPDLVREDPERLLG